MNKYKYKYKYKYILLRLYNIYFFNLYKRFENNNRNILFII